MYILYMIFSNMYILYMIFSHMYILHIISNHIHIPCAPHSGILCYTPTSNFKEIFPAIRED